MHKPFQKFGLFVSKLEEATVSNDKKIKYLYKKDSPSDKYKRKIKSADDSNTKSKFLKKFSEDKHRIQKKKSDESFRKKHRKIKDRSSNAGFSEAEIFIAEDEKPKKKNREEKNHEIKRKRSKHRTEAEGSEKRTVKKEDNFTKLLKQYKFKSSSKDSQWINKRDILKLISNVRDLPRDAGSGLLKKLFAFEKTPEKEATRNKASRRHSREERSSIVPLTVESYRTLEKKTRERERLAKEKSELYVPKKVKKHKTEKEHKNQYEEETPAKPKKKHKKKSEEKKFVFEELPPPVVKKENIKRNHEKYFLREIDSNIKSVEAVSMLPDPVRQHVTNINRTNPLRHMQCLVKKTFSIVEISPQSSVSYLEKKKNMKQFKKYYQYNRHGEIDLEMNHDGRSFSDCHKMYQEVSTDEDASRRRKTKKRGDHEANLRLETHISAVVIPADSERFIQEWSENTEDKKVKKKTQRSRIPILSNFNKVIESARDSPRSFKTNIPITEQPNPRHEEKYLPVEECRDFSPRDEKTIKTLRKKITDNVSTKATSERSSHFGDKSSKAVKPPTKESSVDRKSSKLSTLPRNTKTPIEKVDKRDERPKPRPRTYRRSPMDEKCSIKSNDYSSVYSRNSRKSTRSKSDTRISAKRAAARKCKTFERSSTKTSLSNSTFGDRSMESKNGTTFLLTKNFKDDEKLSRWQKRKLYSDQLRRNLINKGKKSSAIPQQVLEVRYLTVDKKENHLDLSARTSRDPSPHSKRTKHSVDVFFENDLPQPSFDLVADDKIKDMFETPIDEALDEILNENYNFLKKDFSYPCNAVSKLSVSDEASDEKEDWYNFQETESLTGSLSHRSASKEQQQHMCLTSQEHITDSCSAPGSDESGYSTIKSRKMSRSFFERTEIQNLLKPNFESSFNPFCMDVQIEHNDSSLCELEIHSIQSKSLQTIVECSQKSVQIKLSQEEILEMINFSEDEVVKAVNRDIEDESEPEINSESVSEINLPLIKNANQEISVEKLKDNEITEIDKEEMVRDLLNEVLANVVKSKSAVIISSKEKAKVSTILKKVKRQMLFYFCIRCTSSDE